jgi:hypothetical protein
MQRLLNAVEKILPFIHEESMEGETVFECAVLELELAFKLAAQQGAHPTGLCPMCGEPLAAAALHEFCYPPASPIG